MGKILPKCQICDGQIVNGKCKYCGMPYRRDEVLYHLNENRRDHEKHAASKAKETLRRAETPRYEAPRRTETPRYEAPRRTAAAAGKRVQEKKNTGKGTEKNKGNHKGILVWILILLFIFLPRGVEWIQEKGASGITAFLQSRENADEFMEEMPVYFLKSEDGEIQVGGPYLDEGRYQILVRNGYATLKVVDEEEVTRYSLSKGESEKVRLKNGYVISVHNASSGSTCVEFYDK